MGYRPDKKGEANIRRQLRAELLRVGRELVEEAKQRSPAGVRSSAYGEFSKTFRVERVGEKVIVGSTSTNAHLVEFGSSTTDEFAPLRTAIEANGLTLRNPGESAGRSGNSRGGPNRTNPRRGVKSEEGD